MCCVFQYLNQYLIADEWMVVSVQGVGVLGREDEISDLFYSTELLCSVNRHHPHTHV
jgi:hypothetical protein